jgi:tetratricopeptide (TPR) repeat protein
VVLLSGQYKKAADMYRRLYEKYPDQYLLGEQTAYALLAGDQDAEALAVSEKVLAEHEKDWFCHYIRAVALLKLRRYPESIGAAVRFLALTEDPGLKQSRDTFLNAYMMAYAPATKDPAAVTALQGDAARGLIADYALGVTAWKDKDYPLAISCLDRVIAKEPALGYAWYAKGCVLNEKLKTDRSAREEEAEACYLQCAAVEPGSLEVWFSLGNLYRTWPGHEKDALRCYRRIVDLEPSVDHSHDYYGTVYHAKIAIQELKAFDE